MKSLIWVALALLLLVVGFRAGQSVNVAQILADCVASAPVQTAFDNEQAEQIPSMDVPSADIADLPRYPGAVRVEYRQSMAEELLLTAVEYVVAAPLNEVRDFYRTILVLLALMGLPFLEEAEICRSGQNRCASSRKDPSQPP
jgi:hypothetical protein